MLQALTGKTKSALCILNKIELLPVQQALLDEWIWQRVEEYKPLQYILGSVPFCDLTIQVRSPILIPRPETEEWVAWLIEQLKPLDTQGLRILDLCTGTGCIALALARHLPGSIVMGIDINPEAIALAQENQKAHNLSNVQFILSDLYAALPQDMKFDLIVTNPPYLCPSEYDALSEDVKKWEDPRALVAQDRGMQLYQYIIADAHRYLDVQGRKKSLAQAPAFVCEIGPAQKESIKNILVGHGFKSVDLINDLQGFPRWAIAFI
ncbi:peptide chain release factor N(5)-glutamine methyltransferase [Candidatus Dependentiae bacterium]|nr:peptide chain release factor N(5)-glutamine methyltransferase [Candidatus Dependentiae bacterium]